MNSTLTSSNHSFTATLQDLIEYPTNGILSKVLLKDHNSQYNLLCLGAGTEIDEHAFTHNAVVTVIAGSGNLNLEGRKIALEPGVFVFIPANAPHAVQAQENLAFVLALSEQSSLIPETNHTQQTVLKPFNLENPAHAIYLGLGDRDW